MTKYRYSRWDGSQQVFEVDEDSLLGALSDDLLAHGDLDRALRDLFQRGIRGEDQERRMEGLRDLIERLKTQRQQHLERNNLDSLMGDIKERLQDVIDSERRGINRRLQEASQQLSQAPESAEGLRRPMRVLEEQARQSKEALDRLPDSVAGAIKELSEYDFMDSEAHQKFQELLDMLRQRTTENLLQDMRRQLQTLSPEQMEELKGMLQALNQMLRHRAEGRDPDFDVFMEQFGHQFDPDRPADLDMLMDMLEQGMAAMQSLMDSLPPEMRGELESLMQSAVDTDMMRELSELAAHMQRPSPYDDLSRALPFLSDEPPALDQAMELMGQLQDMDELEKLIRQAMRTGAIDAIDLDKVEEVMGEDARRLLEQLQQIVQQLQEAGYLKREGERLELTPREVCESWPSRRLERCSRPSRRTAWVATSYTVAAMAESIRQRPKSTSSGTPSTLTCTAPCSTPCSVKGQRPRCISARRTWRSTAPNISPRRPPCCCWTRAGPWGCSAASPPPRRSPSPSTGSSRASSRETISTSSAFPTTQWR